MATIQSLPEELLLVVVQMVQRQEQQSHSIHSLSRSRSKLRILLLLSLVCKSWREAILECGVLWASIAVDTSRDDCLAATLIMLGRSKGVELELSMYFNADGRIIEERTDRVLESILGHRARITSLHMTGDLPFTLGRDAQVLGMTAHASTPTNHPSLQTLSRRLSGLFRGLRELSLSSPSSSAVVRISELLDIVNNSQGLELLSLTSFLFTEEDRPSTCVVQPPRLRRLYLRECNSATVLSRLATPKTTVINIALKKPRARRYPSIHGTHILGALPPSLSSICTLEETTKLVFKEDKRGHYFGLELSSLCSQGPSVTIRRRSSSRERFIRASLRAISENSYFDIIESFTFSYSSPVPAAWPMVFSRFCALAELNTLVIHAADVLHTLIQTTFDGTPPYFSLRRIRFFEQLPNQRHLFHGSQLFPAFHNFRAEYHCPRVRVTLHCFDGRKEEL